MKPIAALTRDEAAGIRYVLTDIDDTITTDAKLLPDAYAALWTLKAAGLRIIPVTGRAAGRCDIIAREWPVDGILAESGAVAFWEESLAGGRRVLRQEPHPGAVRNTHPALARIRERALVEVPGIKPAKDQFSRLYDMSLDYAEEEPVLSYAEAEKARQIALEEGARANISSIHVNVWMGHYDKLSMAEWFLARYFGWQAGAGDREVFYIGDAPNDEPLFARFPLAAAVANIRRYEGRIRYYPAYVASRQCGEGFAEIVAALLEKRR
ncbi:MAG: HAD-IIB family hydrolase [Treponema sp.]|jgi:HAD superfamily hydrolase (TIGR01484 family)|nr:HAD-IIB family hydrolase [Treponema sp.]